MSYLVIELQKDAVNQEINTTTLLRKALIVAKKLKIVDFEAWINLELNGYLNATKEIPEYRTIKGILRALHPYQGWIQTSFNGNSEMEMLFTSKEIYNSIGEIESLKKNNDQFLDLCFATDAEECLNDLFGKKTKYKLSVSKSQFESILESVTTTILRWALKLEEDKILGEEMLFSEKEKKIAIEKNYTVNHFHGNIINSQIQQNSENSRQDY